LKSFSFLFDNFIAYKFFSKISFSAFAKSYSSGKIGSVNSKLSGISGNYSPVLLDYFS